MNSRTQLIYFLMRKCKEITKIQYLIGYSNILCKKHRVHTYIYMAISFRFRFFIKRQPEILIKFEQTLPENNNVLEILQQENCTPNQLVEC